MDKRRKLRLGDLLIQAGVLNEKQLVRALEEQKDTGKKLGEVLVSTGVLSEKDITQALKKQLQIESVSLEGIHIPEDIIPMVDAAVLRKYCVLPYAYAPNNANVLLLAMSDPMDLAAQDDISIITNMQVEPVIASSREIMATLDKYYGHQEAMEAAEQYAREKDFKPLSQVEEQNDDVDQSPIVLLVKSIIEQAVRQRASDIHIEPTERKLRVRYRIDGALVEKMSYDIRLLPAVSARIKIIGGMDISEKRKPQDGRLTMNVNHHEYDIRASLLPTVYGEKIVLRLTMATDLTKNKSELGLNEEETKQFDLIFSNPHGMVLVTGPTGSGKSTTLYTALSELNKEDVNIITVEDPVEANISGINQVQVNPKSEMTFGNVLRSILRQDPDIIMIGEIRDAETANIAVQASITGHLVVSTLHTNSAAATVTRLEDMGLEPYLLGDSLSGIIAQRLVRRLCPHCKVPHLATAEEMEMLGEAGGEPITIYEPGGCEVCSNTGYYGRIGIFEILAMNQELKRIISSRGGTEAIREAASRSGMKTLKMSCIDYVKQGITSTKELMQIAIDE
ncbi:MAG: type II secretion system protein GspE [Clostridia bacterium]|nr:type II secretion system protein GspE [Clostridia bacterium]NCD03462.1 type II secretion system protein GspE [Clostridia bacterium]